MSTKFQTNYKKQQILTNPKYNLSHNSIINIQYIQNQCTQLQNEKKCVKYKLVLMWKEQLIQRDILVGDIDYMYVNDVKQMERAIIRDLIKKGFVMKEETKIMARFRKSDQVIIQMEGKLQQSYIYSQPIIQGIILQSRIIVPAGYIYSPTKFIGCIIPNLSISNQYGTITWNTPVCINQLNLKQSISIGQSTFQIKNPLLLTDILVQFNTLTPKLQKYFLELGQTKFQKKLHKKINHLSNNQCRFMKYFQNNQHWFIHVIFNNKNKDKVNSEQNRKNIKLNSEIKDII